MSEFKEFPKHLHKPGGAFLVVQDTTEEKAALKDGWSLTKLADAEPEGPVEATDPQEPATNDEVPVEKPKKGRKPKAE